MNTFLGYFKIFFLIFYELISIFLGCNFKKLPLLLSVHDNTYKGELYLVQLLSIKYIIFDKANNDSICNEFLDYVNKMLTIPIRKVKLI